MEACQEMSHSRPTTTAVLPRTATASGQGMPAIASSRVEVGTAAVDRSGATAGAGVAAELAAVATRRILLQRRSAGARLLQERRGLQRRAKSDRSSGGSASRDHT